MRELHTMFTKIQNISMNSPKRSNNNIITKEN